MSACIEPVSRDDLWRRIQSGEDFVLVDALPQMSYARSHLPGAINLPIEWVDLWAARRIPDHDAEIVVYCAKSTCNRAETVADRLIALGYRNIRHYVEGKSDWIEAGLPVEGGRA
jgi:rhodanese-related sulfurtransferase